MNSIARLRWHKPIELDLSENGKLRAPVNSVPTSRGMYIFARKTRAGIIPVYVGVASRSLRQRFKQHLTSKRMREELVDGRRSKRLFFYAEVTPGTLAFAKRYLGSFERALILSATASGGATLNRHQRKIRSTATSKVCCFVNAGHRPAWVDWTPCRVTTELLPPRRRRLTIG